MDAVLSSVLFLMSYIGMRKLNKTRSKVRVVSDIWIYPIKGCRGFRVNSWPIYRRGFAYDRLFMVVDEKMKFVSQRGLPLMTKIITSIDASFKNLRLSFEGFEDIVVPLESSSNATAGGQESLDVIVWGDSCKATEIPAGSAWISKVLNDPNLKLVRMNDEYVRATEDGSGETGFADGFPFLMVSKEGFDQINSKLQRPVSIENFRPNIVITGCTPFEEDLWKEVEFTTHSGEGKKVIKMECVNPCSRCKVPNNDPETGVFDAQNEPTATLKTFRSGELIGLKKERWLKQLFVGQHMAHFGATGVLTVNDTLEAKSFNDWRA